MHCTYVYVPIRRYIFVINVKDFCKFSQLVLSNTISYNGIITIRVILSVVINASITYRKLLILSAYIGILYLHSFIFK